jgi:hypothetical protein
LPKYVATRSLNQTTWNAALLGANPSSAIAALKGQPGTDPIKYGTNRFDNTLVRGHLIDDSASGPGPSWPAEGDGCSRTSTPPGSTSR